MQRNDYIFKGIAPSIAGWLQTYKKQFALIILRAKARHKTVMFEWLEAFM
jgi:hypothetical protein